MVASRVVIVDKPLVGWANKNANKLSKRWWKVKKIGTDKDLPQRSSDKRIATYCKKHDCDFLTPDKTAYTYYFEAKIKTVCITKHGRNKIGDQPIYLIEISQTA